MTETEVKNAQKSAPKQSKKVSRKTKSKKNPQQHQKVFVIDTNIILNDHTAPFSLKNCEVVLPQMVIRELDKKQDFAHNKSAAYNARAFGRRLRALLKKQKSATIRLDNGSKIVLEKTSPDVNKVIDDLGLEPRKPDSFIVASAYDLKKKGRNVTLLTNDTNMWVTGVSLGIQVEDYEVRSDHKKDEAYTGVKVFELEDTALIADLYNHKKVFLDEKKFPDLHLNQIVVLKGKKDTDPHSSVLTMFKGYNRPLYRIRYGKGNDYVFSGVSPLNKEQAFAFALLDDKNISCVTLSGKAGTGKSIITLSYALERLGKRADGGRYDQVLILKPVIPVGRDIGFLPGTMEEKLEPWMKSFIDTLQFIFKGKSGDEFTKDGVRVKNNPHQYLIETGAIQFQPLTFMRGRSLQDTLIILDECQNCTIHEVKTLITRIGEGSKVIALGDVDQVDAPWLDKKNNGLAYLIEKGKDAEMLGHITLIKSHRSALADWASDNL